MCCGSKRSAWHSPSPPPREAHTPAPVAPGPIPPTQEVDVRDAGVSPRNNQFRLSSPQLEVTAARLARRWRLSG